MNTPLDQAHLAALSAPGHDGLRLAFLERLAEAELYLWLEREPEGDMLEPRVFPLSEGPVVLAFDLEERLSAFAEGPACRAVLSGRALAALLAGRGLGLGLNLGDAPSAQILPADAVDWLAGLGEGALAPETGRPEAMAPPHRPEAEAVLRRKLALAAGLASHGWLVDAVWPDTRRGPLFVLVDPRPGAGPALAAAIGEAARFADGVLDDLALVLASAEDAIAREAAVIGRRIDLPPAPEPALRPSPPGSMPDRPPRLR